ncbi:MAG TPA: glycosyltransferase family 2 protein [Stellaceae bacterium]|nr:glycosyltransferase family 2 protein [Stellaceae bacterium]
MAVLSVGVAWAALIGWLLLRIVRQFSAYRSMSLGRLPLAAAPAAADVALIVPARNEIANITDCLASLSAQRGLGSRARIIVVDDGSKDGTGEAVSRAALSDPRIMLIDAGRLPAGWMGKPHACWRGALASDTEWLCFIDADVRAAPEAIQVAVAAATQHRIDFLSLNTFPALVGFWERLIVPAALVLIACVQDLRRVDDPASHDISVNGQFMLIRREAYFAAGGHGAVQAEVAEDKALALRVKRQGWRYRMLGAEDLVQARLYADFASLWQGFAKNATEILGDGAATIAAASAAMVLAWSALLLPVLTGILAVRQASDAAAAGFACALLGSISVLGLQLASTRRFRVPAAIGLLFPAGYTAIAALAWYSAALYRGGRVSWKGRTYRRLDRRA